jgi:hypothetical protein
MGAGPSFIPYTSNTYECRACSTSSGPPAKAALTLHLPSWQACRACTCCVPLVNCIIMSMHTCQQCPRASKLHKLANVLHYVCKQFSYTCTCCVNSRDILCCHSIHPAQQEQLHSQPGMQVTSMAATTSSTATARVTVTYKQCDAVSWRVHSTLDALLLTSQPAVTNGPAPCAAKQSFYRM